MYRFSADSLEELATCDQRLILVAFKAIEVVDFSIIEGARTAARQRELYMKGKTKRIHSNHIVDDKNKVSRAFDFLPYPFSYTEEDWNNRERFAILGGTIIGIGYALGVKLRWGGDWDRTYNPAKNGFYDGMHIELYEW